MRDQQTCLPIITLEISLYPNYNCGFYSSISLIQSGQINKHTQQLSFNNIDYKYTLTLCKFCNQHTCIVYT